MVSNQNGEKGVPNASAPDLGSIRFASILQHPIDNNQGCVPWAHTYVLGSDETARNSLGVHIPESLPTVKYPLASNPPRNCPDGGQWGTVHYTGNKTGALALGGCLVCGFIGLFILACPQDQKDAYLYDDKVYDASGTFIGRKSRVQFVPSRNS